MRVFASIVAALSLGAGCASSSEARRPPESDAARQQESAVTRAAPADLDAPTRARAEKILQESLSSADSEMRGEALTAIGVARTADAEKVLGAALAELDGDIRFAAARGLRHLAAPSSADAIVAAWKKEKGWSVKKELALAAGASKAQALVPELQSVLETDSRQELKIAAAWGLHDLGDARGAQALKQLGNPPRPGAQKEGTDRWSRKVLNGEREGDRVLAARVLAEAATSEDLPLFVRLMEDPQPTVRILAAAGALRLPRR